MEAKPETQQPSIDEFRPTEGGGNTANANVLVVAAYVMFWLLIAGFVALSWRKLRGIESRIDRLERGRNDEA
jgi:CcmD family protein